jgi:hypothetical protein
MEDYKKKDVQLWEAWKANPSKETLSPLFKQLEPVIQKEVSRWATGGVSRPVLTIQAKKLTLDALNSFAPDKAALNTHVTNQLKGLSRQAYTYVSSARIPEHRALKIKTYDSAIEDLKEELGREPTVSELSRELKWSQSEVERMRKELRREFGTSQPIPPGFEQFDSDRGLLDFVYHDLADQDKIVFEHSTGYGGAPILSAKDLTDKTGMTQGQISHSKRRIKSFIETARGFSK